jgi:replicative DNA helicase
MFKPTSLRIDQEKKNREYLHGKFLRFGISFLDAATRGFSPFDIVLIGAPTSVGKTDLCVNIAMANLEDGRRVHYLALESEPNELEQRILYQTICQMYFADKHRPRLDRKLNPTDWAMGFYGAQLERYETEAREYVRQAYTQLHTFYKGAGTFTIDDLIFQMGAIADQTDLIIVDHLHFFDWEDENDNRAMKQILMKTRSLALELGKPVILVAHLRKRDRKFSELVPNVDEFHGSSDLTKVATKAITFSGGEMDDEGKRTVYFRICKNRRDNSVSQFIGRTKYDYKLRKYDEGFKLSKASLTEFEEIQHYPEWALESFRNAKPQGRGNHPHVFEREQSFAPEQNGQGFIPEGERNGAWD